MKKTLKAWTALGAALSAGPALGATNLEFPRQPAITHPAIGGLVESPLATQRDFFRVAEAGDPLEGGSGPISYSLLSTDPNAYEFDAKQEIEAYIDLMRASYERSASEAETMQVAIAAFLDQPSAESLAAARAAWVAARPSYMRTEIGRFYDGPIEDVEGRINAWPLNEAFIDYVEGDPSAGLVNDPSKDISLAIINGEDQAADEADVTTGWHAIEFLLWGQDMSATGPGDRPYTDYLPGQGNNDRRRDYLRLVTQQLTGDINQVAGAWDLGLSSTYATSFWAMAPREALGRIMNGMAILIGSEFMSARLAVGLDSGDQEDEHSCFSDTTHQDFVADLAGAKQVWTGIADGVARPGIGALVRTRDSAIADQVDALFADAEAKIAVLGDPWDQVLASEPGSPSRLLAEEAVTALQALTDGLVKAGAKLGVLVLVPAS